MKHLVKKSLLAAIPTLLILFLSYDAKAEIFGLWYDYYTDTKIEIKPSRNGVKVKHHGGFLRKWRTYNYMGRGVYDDCNGRVIVVLNYDRIRWKTGNYRRSVELTRFNEYGYRDRRSRNFRNDRFDYDYGRRGYGNALDAYCGEWSCNATGVNLRISAYGNGFRAYANNRWSYYEPYQDYYRDRRGNRYYFDNGELCWQDYRGRDRRRFRKG